MTWTADFTFFNAGGREVRHVPRRLLLRQPLTLKARSHPQNSTTILAVFHDLAEHRRDDLDGLLVGRLRHADARGEMRQPGVRRRGGTKRPTGPDASRPKWLRLCYLLVHSYLLVCGTLQTPTKPPTDTRTLERHPR